MNVRDIIQFWKCREFIRQWHCTFYIFKCPTTLLVLFTLILIGAFFSAVWVIRVRVKNAKIFSEKSFIFKSQHKIIHFFLIQFITKIECFNRLANTPFSRTFDFEARKIKNYKLLRATILPLLNVAYTTQTVQKLVHSSN